MKGYTAISRFRGQEGGSLLEMVFVMVLMGIILSVSIGFMNVSARMIADIFQRSFFATEADRAGMIFQRDFSGLRRGDILEIRDDQVRLHRSYATPVVYYFRKGKLYRNGQLLLTHLERYPFRFLNAKKQEVRKAEQVAFIQIVLQFQRNAFRWKRQEWFHVAH